MRRVVLSVLLGLGLGSGSVLGSDSASSWERLKVFSQSVQTLSAEFEQTSLDAQGYVLETLTGTFHFSSPNRFRWTYVEPMTEVIVGDGQFLWHFDPLLEQVTQRSQPDASVSPMLALVDADALARSYEVVSGADDDRIDLIPRDPEAAIELAWIILAGDAPETVGWLDPFGQVTQLTLSAVEVNPVLSGSLFIFEPPDGVDVLRGL